MALSFVVFDVEVVFEKAEVNSIFKWSNYIRFSMLNLASAQRSNGCKQMIWIFGNLYAVLVQNSARHIWQWIEMINCENIDANVPLHSWIGFEWFCSRARCRSKHSIAISWTTTIRFYSDDNKWIVFNAS